MSLIVDKESIRLLVRERGRGIPAAERQRASQQIVERLLSQPLWQRAATLLLYWPLPSEPDIRPLFEAAWRQGKRTALLSYDPAGDQFQPRRVQNLGADLRVNSAFKMPEPSASCPLLPANQLDLVLVPGVAFTWSGCRLGRGRGYYDRFLARGSGIAVGVAYDWQMVEEIPTEPHDMGVHCIVTPMRWQEVAEGPQW